MRKDKSYFCGIENLMRNTTATICLLLSFLTFTSLQAQSSLSPTSSDNYPKFLSATYNQGWVLKHRKSIEGIPDAYPQGIELNFGWQTTGRKAWHQLHNYPRWGLQLLYYNLGVPQQLGHAVFFTPYMDLFALKRRKHELYFKIGTGVAFFTEYYDEKTNPHNTFVSLPASISGLFSFNYRIIATPHWSFLFGFNFNHGSNAAMRQPNLGINVPSLQIGTHYTFHPERLNFVKQELPEVKKSLNWYTHVGFATKQSYIEPLNDANYLVVALSTAAGKRLTRKSMVLAGLDGCYDESLKYTLKDNEEYKENKYPIYRFAATLGYEFILTEKTHILMQNGFYLYDPYGLDIPVYQRFGFRFLPFEHFYAGYFLKTHLGKADYWEIAFGVKI